MKTLILFVFLTIGSLANAQAVQGINWMTTDQVEEAMKTQKKKIFIDLYTDWCGWCKRMDATTFKDPAIVEYMNRNYYCIKFNAERRDTVRFNNFDFYDLTPDGKKGTNYLAYSLLEGRMSYPSFVILDENFSRLYVIAGYKQPEPMYGLLMLFGTNEYQNYNNFLYMQLQKQQEAQKQQGQ
jgi:thioredoxin-related protein